MKDKLRIKSKSHSMGKVKISFEELVEMRLNENILE